MVPLGKGMALTKGSVASTPQTSPARFPQVEAMRGGLQPFTTRRPQPASVPYSFSRPRVVLPRPSVGPSTSTHRTDIVSATTCCRSAHSRRYHPRLHASRRSEQKALPGITFRGTPRDGGGVAATIPSPDVPGRARGSGGGAIVQRSNISACAADPSRLDGKARAVRG